AFVRQRWLVFDRFPTILFRFVEHLLYPGLLVSDKDLETAQTEHSGSSLFDKMQQVREILVLACVRSDARDDLFIKRRFTLEEFVESLGQPTAQRRCEESERKDQQRFDESWSNAVSLRHPVADRANAEYVNRQHHRGKRHHDQTLFDDYLEIAITVDVVSEKN